MRTELLDTIAAMAEFLSSIHKRERERERDREILYGQPHHSQVSQVSPTTGFGSNFSWSVTLFFWLVESINLFLCDEDSFIVKQAASDNLWRLTLPVIRVSV